MTKGEEEILLNLKKIKDGLDHAIRQIENSIQPDNIDSLRIGFATANITLFQGVSIKTVKKLLKSEQYR